MEIWQLNCGQEYFEIVLYLFNIILLETMNYKKTLEFWKNGLIGTAWMKLEKVEQGI